MTLQIEYVVIVVSDNCEVENGQFDCLNGTVCYPFKDYFQRLHHNTLNTRNNGKSVKLPKVKLDFARRSFYFLGASIFNSLPPLSLRNNNSRVLYWKALDDYYL